VRRKDEYVKQKEIDMREITDHIVGGDTAPQLQIRVHDEPGAGGACHVYSIAPPKETPIGETPFAYANIGFQNGPIKEVGVNGVTQEALLAIVIDRLVHFQSGPFASVENEKALACCVQALDWLKWRTSQRIKRGVEGKTVA
jgi:hypothetical protein